MKRILYAIFLLTVIVGFVFLVYLRRESYLALYSSLDPCKKPIMYSVGSVDKRFGLGMDKIVEYSKASADIWNKKYGSDLFLYDPSGELTINMVFDERQKASNTINKLDSDVDDEKNKLEVMIKEHKESVADFKQRLAHHNATVEGWNNRGGAPEDEYKRLTETQNQLEAEARSLNEQAQELNVATEDYNLQVGNLNEAIANFNDDLVEKPEEGLYIGDENRIEIYFNNNRDELIHTIAHELGHARGLDHNSNSKSVMYPFSTKVVTLSGDDFNDLAEACRERSPIEAVRQRLNF